MQSTPIISIIIPTYNASKTLSFALESILMQSFRDYEVLIIDGLSTDNTMEIARGFRDERIRIFSETDHGIYDAMNKGIKLARGEWIYFMGSDDRLFKEEVLESIIRKISLNDYEVIYGDVFSSRFNGRYDGEFNAKKILHHNICHQAVFFKKSIFNKVGFFNLKYKSHADWDHNMRWLLLPTVNKLYIDEVIAEYADSGFSSLNNDIIFRQEKVLNFLCYGSKSLPLSFRMGLLIKEFVKCIMHFDLSFFLKLSVKLPKILMGI